MRTGFVEADKAVVYRKFLDRRLGLVGVYDVVLVDKVVLSRCVQIWLTLRLGQVVDVLEVACERTW